ncbi:protein of unknown function [Aminobacter niigataensis]|nr:protein of unknown function [Aminobacter niigataensis]
MPARRSLFRAGYVAGPVQTVAANFSAVDMVDAEHRAAHLEPSLITGLVHARPPPELRSGAT